MENSEIERKLAELESGLGVKTGAGPFSPSIVKESSAETVRFLQNKLDRTRAEYETLLAGREAAVSELKNQIEGLQEHIRNLKERYENAGEEIVKEQLMQAAKIEETGKILKEQKDNHKRELALIGGVLEQSRDELKNLGDKTERLRNERDKLREKIDALEKERMDLYDKKNFLERNLSEAKKAVEETLGQLLEERKLGREASRKNLELEKKASGLSMELANAKANWEAERKEWRELWDRERSVWETHRQEFAVWEERLRSEREAWLERLRAEEEKGVDSAASISKILEDSSRWSAKVTEILKLYASRGVQLPQVFITSRTAEARVSSGFKKALALGLAGILALSGLSWWIYDYKNKTRFTPSFSAPADDSNYTSVSFYKDGYIASHWSYGLVFMNDKFETVKKMVSFSGQNLKISALAIDGDYAYALDLSQLRFLKLDLNTGEIIKTVRTAGPAPQGLAWDGFNLWSFDASSGLLYKYIPADNSAGVSAYPLKGVKTVAALKWSGGKLFVLSEGRLIRYNFKKDYFNEEASQKIKKAEAFDFEKDKAVFLESDGVLTSFSGYAVKNRGF